MNAFLVNKSKKGEGKIAFHFTAQHSIENRGGGEEKG